MLRISVGLSYKLNAFIPIIQTCCKINILILKSNATYTTNNPIFIISAKKFNIYYKSIKNKIRYPGSLLDFF